MKIMEITGWQKPVRRPPNIIDFLISRGGVLDQGGELRAMDLHRIRKGQWGILSTRRGLPLDYAREAAEEAGYLPHPSTIADLLGAIQATALDHPVYRPEDAVLWKEYERDRFHHERQSHEQEDFWDPNTALAGL